MKSKVLYLLLVLLMASPVVRAQQDPLYSQYLFNPLAINSAYTGLDPVLSASFNSRFQWNALEGSPETYTLAAHSSLFDNKIGAGILLLNDRLGVTQNTEIHLSYSYKIQFDYSKIAFGLRTSLVNYRYDYNQLTLKSLDDPDFLPVAENATKPNFGAGMIYTGKNLFVGLSVPRILNSDFEDGVTSSTRYIRHYYLMTSYLFNIDENLAVKPGVLVKGVSGAPVSLDVNVNFLLENLVWVGFYSRDLNSFGVMGQIELNRAYRLGYSFELLSRSRLPMNYTTHEVSLILDFAIFNFHRFPDKINYIDFRDLFK